MGTIIRMNSREFVTKFLPNVEKQSDFQFIIISETLSTRKELPNIEAIKRLVPPNQILRKHLEGDEKQYRETYAAYLSHPSIEGFLTVIAKAAVVEDMNIVLICSEYEDNWNYLKSICDYLEVVFEIKTHTVKSYLKNPAKASEFKNKKELEEFIADKIVQLEKNKVDLTMDEDVSTLKTIQAKIYEKLDYEDYDKKELRKLAKKAGMKKLDKDLSRKKMMKSIAKYKAEQALKKEKKKAKKKG